MNFICVAAVNRAISQIYGGICQIFTRKTVGPTHENSPLVSFSTIRPTLRLLTIKFTTTTSSIFAVTEAAIFLGLYSICGSVGLLLRGLGPMYPLRCARVRANTAREMSAHKKTWSAHKSSLQKCFCTYFIHAIPNSDEFR